jgi:hypothetical protein
MATLRNAVTSALLGRAVMLAGTAGACVISEANGT